MSRSELSRLKRQHERQMTEDGIWCDGWAMCPCRLAQTIRAVEGFPEPRR